MVACTAGGDVAGPGQGAGLPGHTVVQPVLPCCGTGGGGPCARRPDGGSVAGPAVTPSDDAVLVTDRAPRAAVLHALAALPSRQRRGADPALLYARPVRGRDRRRARHQPRSGQEPRLPWRRRAATRCSPTIWRTGHDHRRRPPPRRPAPRRGVRRRAHDRLVVPSGGAARGAARSNPQAPLVRRRRSRPAAAVGVIAWAGGSPREPLRRYPGPVKSPTPSPTDHHHRPHSASSEPAVGRARLYVGDTPLGPRLYREFQRVDADNPLLGAARVAYEGTLDRTLWAAGLSRTSRSS